MWNKVDLLDDIDAEARRVEASRIDEVFTLSAVTGEGFDALLEAVEAKLETPRETLTMLLEFSKGKQRAWLFAQGIVDAEEPGEDGWTVTVTWTERQKAEYAAL